MHVIMLFLSLFFSIQPSYEFSLSLETRGERLLLQRYRAKKNDGTCSLAAGGVREGPPASGE